MKIVRQKFKDIEEEYKEESIQNELVKEVK